MSTTPFRSSNLRADAWFSVGLAASFPDITDPGPSTVSDLRFCGQDLAPSCKVFHVPRADSSQAREVAYADGSVDGTASAAKDLRDQVLVFQYKGKFHAVNNQCPHSSYPLANGTPFDIEDFGVVLSAGITCPKHGWSFDLFSGTGDRGTYRLRIWEVQLRPVQGVNVLGNEKEVWVRRKQRIG